MVLKRIIKPKNQRAKRYLDKRQALVHENDKNAIFIKGGKTSEIVTRVLKELSVLKKPLASMFHKKNMTRPFDDGTSIEFFSNKTDSSLFMFGSDSKKRPHNLILGRLYDHQILDMFEFGINKFISTSEFPGEKITCGTKPCLIFSGDAFEKDIEFSRLKNLLTDFFRGPRVGQIRLSGIEHAYSFTLHEGKLFLRSYRILLKKSGSRIPRIELEEIGPSLDMTLRRQKIASNDMYKLTLKQPKQAKIQKKKNVEEDGFGSKLGRVHMRTQDFTELQTRKMKGLKIKKISRTETEKNGDISGGEISGDDLAGVLNGEEVEVKFSGREKRKSKNPQKVGAKKRKISAGDF